MVKEADENGCEGGHIKAHLLVREIHKFNWQLSRK